METALPPAPSSAPPALVAPPVPDLVDIHAAAAALKSHALMLPMLSYLESQIRPEVLVS